MLCEMPSLDALKASAEAVGLELAPWDGVKWDAVGPEAAAEILDDFYLAVLRRPAEKTYVKL